MMITDEMIEKAKEVAENYFWDYEKIGIRVQEEPFELGRISHCSHIWDDGEDTGEELDGICAQDVNQFGTPYQLEYFGYHVAVLGCNAYTYGQDSGEIVMEDAEVLAILA